MYIFIQKFKKIQNLLNNFIAFTLIAAMTIIFVQTLCRYVIFHSLPWSEELSRYLFIFMVLIGVNIGITQDMMVNIDLIDSFLTPKLKMIAADCRLFFGIIVNCFFFYSTFGMIRIGRYQVSPAMRIPMCYLYAILCLGFFFAILSTIVKIIEMHHTKKEGE